MALLSLNRNLERSPIVVDTRSDMESVVCFHFRPAWKDGDSRWIRLHL